MRVSPKKKPAYSRINSRLMQAFKSIPVIEMPAETTARKPRMYEIRTYESHTMEMTALKVEMFDKGETQLMRDVKLGPVFFGETLIGDNVPNLTYMLSAADMDAHLEHPGLPRRRLYRRSTGIRSTAWASSSQWRIRTTIR